MCAILRKENWCRVADTRFNPPAFPATLSERAFANAQLETLKVSAILALILLVCDDLVDTIAMHTDPALARAALKDAYQFDNQSKILTLTSQLTEGDSVEDYIKKARELWNRLASMGEAVIDKSMIRIILNGLFRSYEKYYSNPKSLQH